MILYSKMREKTILFDLCHNEMLNIDEEEFSDFKDLLKNLNLKIKKIKSENLRKSDIENIHRDKHTAK